MLFFSARYPHHPSPWRCAVNQKIIKLVFFTALAIGTASAAVKQQTPQLVEQRDRRCPLHFDNQKIVFYPHESDCTRYYLCAENGTLVDLECPRGLEFDADYSVRTTHSNTLVFPLFRFWFDWIECRNAVGAHASHHTKWRNPIENIVNSFFLPRNE